MKHLFLISIIAVNTALSSVKAVTTDDVIEPILQRISTSESSKDRGFYMSKYEVTVAQFSQFIADTGYQVPKNCMAFTDTRWPDPQNPASWDLPVFIENPYRPVVCTGIQGALDYANWLAQKTGKPYRLPSESQWRQAALAGKAGRMAFADDFQQREICNYENTEDIANIAGFKKHHQVRYKRSANCNDGAVYHTVVGMYRPNQFGLYDMMGNVREFTRTCHEYSDAQRTDCKRYVVAGEAWHWQPRGVNVLDWIDRDFQGGLEGIRLVLEADDLGSVTAATMKFSEQLNNAQNVQRSHHAKLKMIPATPTGVKVGSDKNKSIKISWLDVEGEGNKYAVYRAISDPANNLATHFVLLVDELQSPEYTDITVPEQAYVRYQVFSYNEYGEGLGSHIVAYGNAKIFKESERIEAEHFFDGQYYWLGKRESATIVGFSDNPDHFPTGVKPHKPAWVKVAFEAKQTKHAQLTFRAMAEQDSGFELWQGAHLVGRYHIPKGDKFTTYHAAALLIASNEPLEIRLDKQVWFELDWLAFK
ncbi:formylglycine-generating enzyme family protein [Pseudoalteromonas sp. T1lg23B]|uniref:formylglycine-generating enzyme family protein n=1 Tax=Pseudoalteromonas sp. T1lg23B TaxID=2077097 RepID=UPI000CF6A0DC|nr:SUMF1/EgtB/PvdO family nonheme iron enzyme [Pseudoalteromonas sp. T1lg23B]